MTSVEGNFISKRVNDTSKKSSPLKVVSPIIKKYSGHRQGKLKKKLEFPRRLPGKKPKNKTPTKPLLKTILPKTNAGDVVIVESELLPCALNLQAKRKREDNEVIDEFPKQVIANDDEKQLKVSSTKDCSVKTNKTKINVSTKRKKQIKNIEATYALFKPQTEIFKEKREQAFAENYLARVQQKLKGKDEVLYCQFVDLISNFQQRGLSVMELYKTVRQMFSKYTDLGEDFIAFLTPSQAVDCGVFMEYLLLTTMTDFLSMVDIYFSKSPHQLKKIHGTFEKLLGKQNVTTDEVKNVVLPLLKGNTVLEDYFLRLLPHSRPPVNFLTDFEEMEYPELNSDVSEDEEHFEVVKAPEIEDVFGGDSCPCICHDSKDDKFKTRILHCNTCSVKFINGKIFIQHGKLLKPAKVTFEDFDMAYHKDRLVPKHYPSRGRRKKTRMSLFKENLSPTKSCYLSSDEFKSDIEEDEKIKSKLGLNKSPRMICRRIASPKNCDRIPGRSIFSDSKSDAFEPEEKSVLNKCSADIRTKDETTRELINETAIDFDYVTTIKLDMEMKKDMTDSEVFRVKPLDLPLIDGEEAVFFREAALPESWEGVKKECEETRKVNSNSLVLTGKDGSKSPPVISIPDSANPPLFPSGKPILSFLEDLDNSKEPVLLISDQDAVINFELTRESDKNSTNVKREDEKNDGPWKIEEDRIILQTLQVEENCEETFRKINDKIPNRSLDDIKQRFANLMNMLYEMKAKTSRNDKS